MRIIKEPAVPAPNEKPLMWGIQPGEEPMFKSNIPFNCANNDVDCGWSEIPREYESVHKLWKRTPLADQERHRQRYEAFKNQSIAGFVPGNDNDPGQIVHRCNACQKLTIAPADPKNYQKINHYITEAKKLAELERDLGQEKPDPDQYK